MSSIAECLADEIMAAEKANLQTSHAMREKDNIEKNAKSNRWFK